MLHNTSHRQLFRSEYAVFNLIVPYVLCVFFGPGTRIFSITSSIITLKTMALVIFRVLQRSNVTALFISSFIFVGFSSSSSSSFLGILSGKGSTSLLGRQSPERLRVCLSLGRRLGWCLILQRLCLWCHLCWCVFSWWLPIGVNTPLSTRMWKMRIHWQLFILRTTCLLLMMAFTRLITKTASVIGRITCSRPHSERLWKRLPSAGTLILVISGCC